jgi:hypothetical protein
VRRSCRGFRVWLAASHVCAIGLVVGGTSLAAAAGPVSTPTVPTIPPSDSRPELPTVSVPLPGLTPGTTPPTSGPGSGAGGSGSEGNRGVAGTQAGGSANTSSSPGVSPGASGGGTSISAPSGRPVGATRGAARSAPRRIKHGSGWPVAASVVSVVSLAIAAFCTRRRWKAALREQWRKRVGHRRSGVESVSPIPGAPRPVTAESKSGARLAGTSEQGATLDPADAAAARHALAELASEAR